MGYRIRELREQAKITQEELAEKSGVSRTIISNLESGRETSSTMKTLDRLAKVFGVTLDQLFTP